MNLKYHTKQNILGKEMERKDGVQELMIYSKFQRCLTIIQLVLNVIELFRQLHVEPSETSESNNTNEQSRDNKPTTAASSIARAVIHSWICYHQATSFPERQSYTRNGNQIPDSMSLIEI
jgi:hypothetical protein